MTTQPPSRVWLDANDSPDASDDLSGVAQSDGDVNEPVCRYQCINRPAMYGTAPGGWWERDGHLPTEDEPWYDTVTYGRKLSPRDIYRYELLPLDVEIPLYPDGARVRNMDTGKVGVITLYDDVWLGIRDEVLNTLWDWLKYEPASQVASVPSPHDGSMMAGLRLDRLWKGTGL